MSRDISVEHVSLGLLGPVPHTRTQAMSIHCLIIRCADRIILVDTGFGTREMQNPNQLVGFDAIFKLGFMTDTRMTAVERLRAQGIAPGDVSDIVLTHMDNDHAGGLHDFPNAIVHVSSEELNSYESIQPRGPYRPYQISHLTKFKMHEPSSEKWFGLEARSIDISEDLQLKLIPLPGHTFGHCGVAYRENGKWSLHAGDAYFDSSVNFIVDGPALPIEAAFQSDAEKRVDSIKKLQRLRAEHGDEIDIFCTHDEHEFRARTSGVGAPDPIVDPLFL